MIERWYACQIYNKQSALPEQRRKIDRERALGLGKSENSKPSIFDFLHNVDEFLTKKTAKMAIWTEATAEPYGKSSRVP